MAQTKSAKLRKKLEREGKHVPYRKVSDNSLLTRRTKTKKDKLQRSMTKHKAKALYSA